MSELHLKKGNVILVDEEDLPTLHSHTWHVGANGYACTTINYVRVLMHRFLMGATAGTQVDHINGIKLDNRKSNLRIVDQATNSKNIHKKSPGKSTDYFGVYRYEREGRIKQFWAYITCNAKRYSLGYYLTPEEAALAYNKKAEELGFLTRNVVEVR